jgi:hypothetical protein
MNPESTPGGGSGAGVEAAGGSEVGRGLGVWDGVGEGSGLGVGVGVGVGEGSGLGLGLGLGLGVGFLSAAIAGANDPTVKAAARTKASLLDRPHPRPWFMDLSSLSGEAFTGGFEASPLLHTREPHR